MKNILQACSESFNSHFQKEQFLHLAQVKVIDITRYSSFLVMSITFDLRTIKRMFLLEMWTEAFWICLQNIFQLFETMCYQFFSQRKYTIYHQNTLLERILATLRRFRSSTSASTSFQLRNRSTHIERESPSQLVLEEAVQYEFLSKSRTEQNEFGIYNIGKNKCALHKQLLRQKADVQRQPLVLTRNTMESLI